MGIPIILSVSWQQTRHQILMSQLYTVSLRTTALMMCSHISRNNFVICKRLCPLHDHYPQTCKCLPPFLKVLMHSPVLPPWHPCKILTNHILWRHCDLFLGTKGHILVWSCNSGLLVPWNALLFPDVPLKGVLHGMTITTNLLLCHSP